MPNDTEIIDAIMSGASLRLVLHPRNDVQTDFPDMYESFDLRHIILKGQRFFAKTSDSHAIPINFGAYDMTKNFAYAYSNYYSYVINSSHTEVEARIYNKNVYESLEFIPVNNFELIWESANDSDVKPVEDAISTGRRLKIAMLDQDDYWNIHPVHMPSFYIGKNYFELFTDQDAVPVFMHDEESLELLEKQMQQRLKEAVREFSPRNMREVFDKAGFHSKQPEFYSTFYTIRSNGEYLRGSTVLTQETPERYETLKVFAEKPISN